MRVLKDNFRCVDPKDQEIDKFEDKKMNIADVRGHIIKIMNDSGGADKSNFATDLPKNLFEFIRDKICDDLLDAKDFQKDVGIRNEVQTILIDILKIWSG